MNEIIFVIEEKREFKVRDREGAIANTRAAIFSATVRLRSGQACRVIGRQGASILVRVIRVLLELNRRVRI